MIDSQTIAAFQSGGFAMRDYLVVAGKNASGSPTSFGFWTGADDVQVNVKGLDGTVTNRSFIGGAALDVPAIVSVIGLEVRTVSVGLSQIHASVQDMVRGNDIRLAGVEIHRGVFDAATGELVSMPDAQFFGMVDGAELSTPAEDGEGGLSLSCTTTTVHLTKTNPAMVSDEQQRLRSADRFFIYSDTAGQVEIWWGQAKDKAA